VSEAAAIGVPDETWGKRPYALVVIKEEQKGKVSEEDFNVFFQAFVDRGVIHKWAVPGRIAVVESIPRTNVGKVVKKEIRKGVKALCR
jgi:acyl-CoA synthetase (AMP-forming)/AMP-acid ligase II